MGIQPKAPAREPRRAHLSLAAGLRALVATGLSAWSAPAEANSLGTYRNAFLARYPSAGFNSGNPGPGNPASACSVCHTTPPFLTAYGLSFQAQANHFTEPGLTNALIRQWGAGSLGDLPIPLDVAGDGRAQLGVYRTSTGQIFLTPTAP